VDDYNIQKEVVNIFIDFITHRKDLEKKNHNFRGLPARFLTSQFFKDA